MSESYMESQMQARYDAFDDRVESLSGFIDELEQLCNKHGIDNGDLEFVSGLFNRGLCKPLKGESMNIEIGGIKGD
jgi:hypothetical protein